MSPEQLPSGAVLARGRRDAGPAGDAGRSPSDLAGEAGGVSLLEETAGQAGESPEWTGIRRDPPVSHGKASVPQRPQGPSPRLSRCPDPGEHSSAWGEFEGFRESSAKSEQFSRSLGLLDRPAPAPEERGSPQPQPGGVTGAAALPPSQPILSYENIFKFAFQEITVQQATEDVSTLDQFLEIRSGEKSDLASVHKLCSESRKLWRALQSTDTTSASRRLWSESRCQENFFLVLGIDTAQKLSGTPGSRHGSLITYSLFLKTPLHGNRQHITIPRKKKIFTPRNLKMMFFNSDVC
ncbi:uncharacterized protein CLBA1 isoform X2 [Cynocephalus volans]|uniref:uncharacterized protein CLBA1 isoform X2 n=1 Tax=Cynocephalus volans TaxID=110931 RepID=UPI002FC5C4CE